MRVLVPMAEGFEETEFVTVVDILRRADIEVTTVGLKDGLVNGSHQIKILPDTIWDRINPLDFDALVLPGGFPGFVNLGQDQRVIRTVGEMDRSGKYIAAICGAPSVLVKAGVLKGRKATVNPAGKKEVAACAQYSDERVVVDGKLITSQSVGTALEFALKLVEILAGREKMVAIKEQILART